MAWPDVESCSPLFSFSEGRALTTQVGQGLALGVGVYSARSSRVLLLLLKSYRARDIAPSLCAPLWSLGLIISSCHRTDRKNSLASSECITLRQLESLFEIAARSSLWSALCDFFWRVGSKISLANSQPDAHMVLA